MIARIVLLLHSMVLFYLRSCVQYLQRDATFSHDKITISSNLNTIAEDETKDRMNEEEDKALINMSSIQEDHEGYEYQYVKRRRKLLQQGGSYSALCTTWMKSTKAWYSSCCTCVAATCVEYGCVSAPHL